MAGSSSGTAAFEWGNKEPGTESSYQSMLFKGVRYNLHECVLCRSGRELPFVGKLMRLFEDEAGAKKVRLRWFFRPCELPAKVKKDLSRNIHNTNELFIALGNVRGVENENVVEVIEGKVVVLCSGRFGGSILPSSVQFDAADFFFTRAFDVPNKKLLKMMSIPNKVLAQKLANKVEWMTILENMEVEEPNSATTEDSQSSSVRTDFGNKAMKRPQMKTSTGDSCVFQPMKKMKAEGKIDKEEV